MKNYLSILKLVLAASCFISSFACNSQNPNGGNSSNTLVNGGDSNTNVPAKNIVIKENMKAPELVCAWLPEFSPGEYKTSTGMMKSCKTEKTEELGAGKRLLWSYKAIGGAAIIKYVELHLASNNKPEITQKAEQRFVKLAEMLWRKAFDEPLPNEIKDELLIAKGKPTMSLKDFGKPMIATIIHADAGNGIYGLDFRFYLEGLENKNY